MQELLLLKNELLITFLIFLLLFIKIGKGMENGRLLLLIQVLLFINVVIGFILPPEGSLFSGMFQTNLLISFQKNILSIGSFMISLLCADWLKKTPHLSEFFMLLLSSLLGMFFMISSGNLLMFFLSLELSTIPIAALANFDLEKRKSSEGAMKMILSSAFSSGILLFGISLIYGATGTISFAELPEALNTAPLQVLAFVFFGFGICLQAFSSSFSFVDRRCIRRFTDCCHLFPFGGLQRINGIHFYSCLVQSISAPAWCLVQYAGHFIIGHYDRWKFIRDKTTKYQALSCFFVYCASGLYSPGHDEQ